MTEKKETDAVVAQEIIRIVVQEAIPPNKCKKCCSTCNKDFCICFHCCVKSWSCCLNTIQGCCNISSVGCLMCSDMCKGCSKCIEEVDCDGK